MPRQTIPAVFVACLALSLPCAAAELISPEGLVLRHPDDSVITSKHAQDEAARKRRIPSQDSAVADDITAYGLSPELRAELSRPVRYAIIGAVIGGIIGGFFGAIRKLLGKRR